MPRRRRLSPVDTTTAGSSDGDGDSEEPRQHPQRNAANARERARMRVLSRAFCRLKTTLPWVPADTKLSKLDTLRLATSYIAHLRAVLTDQPLPQGGSQKHPLSLTWPFSFHQSVPGFVNCDAGSCWTNSQDSEDDIEHMSTDHPNSNHNGNVSMRDFGSYYPQYPDSIMHIG